jgi:UDP-N-acetyl-D-mannosaminuronic acid dehydrogenase
MAKQHELRVSILGLGHIGLPTAAAIALAGYRVVGVDVNQDRLQRIRNGELEHQEAGFEGKLFSLIESHRLNLTDDLSSADGKFDVYVICAQTPLDRNNRPDLRAVTSATGSIADRLEVGSLVTVHSSLPPGTTRSKLAPFLARKSALQCGKDFWLTVSPERMTPSLSLHEFATNPRAIGGYNPKCAQVAASFYTEFIKGKLILTDATVAEVSKLAENAFRDVNIAFANELAQICENLAVPVREVIDLANTHPRVRIHDPGAGVGGPCLPKDPYLLLASAPRKRTDSLILTARKINDEMPNRMVRLVHHSLTRVGKRIKGANIAILGLAYKPDVDDTTYSPAGTIIDLLTNAGASVRTYDPVVRESLGGRRCDSLEIAVRDADCIVIVTEHSVFRDMKLRNLRKLTRDDPIIVDGRSILLGKDVKENGFYYVGIGVPPRTDMSD